MRVPNLHTAPKRSLLESYLEKYEFAKRFEENRLDQIS